MTAWGPGRGSGRDGVQDCFSGCGKDSQSDYSENSLRLNKLNSTKQYMLGGKLCGVGTIYLEKLLKINSFLASQVGSTHVGI